MTQTRNSSGGRHHSERERMLLMTPDRVFYRGLLGTPSLRNFGSITLYVSMGRPFGLSLDGQRWEQHELAVVPPHTAHRIVTKDPLIGSIMIEPESVDPARLPAVLRPSSRTDMASLERIRAAYAYLQTFDGGQPLDTRDSDRLFWGQTLAARNLDPRVAATIERIARDPAGHHSGEVCADEAGLSFSRFLHLFKQETGVAFRKFQAWKRARSLLHHVNRRSSLVDIALDVGYPDSTHFSHAIRQVYGLPPREIFAGSRRLVILRQEPSPADFCRQRRPVAA